MNKKEAQKRITNLESELAALKAAMAETEKLKLWSLEPEGIGFFVDYTGVVCTACKNLSSYKFNLFGNSFQTEEQAEKASPLMARSNKIIKAALQVDPDAGEWRLDEREWGVYFNSDGEWKSVRFGQGVYPLVHVHTKEQANQFAEILNNEGI